MKVGNALLLGAGIIFSLNAYADVNKVKLQKGLVINDATPLIFPNGDTTLFTQKRLGYNNYVAVYNLLDANGETKESVEFPISSDIEWSSATPDGDLWAFTKEQVLLGWDVNTKTYNTVSLNFNNADDEGIVNDNGNLVIFERGASRLIEYSPTLTEVRSVTFDRACYMKMGYFDCGGKNVDVNDITKELDSSSLPQLSLNYTIGRDGNYTTITDAQGNEVFRGLVHSSDITMAAYSDTLVAFYIYNYGIDSRLILMGWDGTMYASLDDVFRVKDHMVFHPNGYLIFEEYHERYHLHIDEMGVTSFAHTDFLNTHNPSIINNYAIALDDSSGSEGTNGGDEGTNGGDEGTNGGDEGGASASGGSGGGSLGWFTLMLVVAGLLRERKTR